VAQTLEVFLHIKFTDTLKEGEVTMDPSKQHLTKKEKKKLPKKKYKADLLCPLSSPASSCSSLPSLPFPNRSTS